MSGSNCCFLTCIQISQEAGKVLVSYSHLFKNFPQFVVIHTVKGFGIVNKTEVDVFLELSCFFLLGQMLILSHFWETATVFHNGCNIIHSHQQCVRVIISPHLHQHFLLSAILMIAILVGVNWNLIVVLIFISMMTDDVECLFLGLLAICMSSLEKCLFRSFVHF